MAQPRIVEVRKNILEKNDQLAHELRSSFAQHGVLAVNFVSGPGAGKTELLRRTLAELGKTQRCAAVTGDLATANDAARLAQSGAPARQILTGTMCHLEADMVAAAIADWSELSGPDELVRALDTLPWRAPDAFLFRQNPTGYTLRLAQDVYPNDPNVRRYTVTFPKQLFDDPRFRTSTVGPFVLVVRR